MVAKYQQEEEVKNFINRGDAHNCPQGGAVRGLDELAPLLTVLAAQIRALRYEVLYDNGQTPFLQRLRSKPLGRTHCLLLKFSKGLVGQRGIT
jgi:hypothetical protein